MPRKSNRISKDEVIQVDSKLPGHRHYKTRQDVIRNPNIIAITNLPEGRNSIRKSETKISHSDLFFDENSKYVIIHDHKLRKQFIDNGIVGENVGVKGFGSRKGNEEVIRSSFTLSSYDYFYAFDELNMIGTGKTGKIKTRSDLMEWGKRHDPNWVEKYSIYRALRERGFIILDAVQYGADFMIYTDDMKTFQKKEVKDHAPILIQMKNNSDQLSVKEMVKSVRLGDVLQKDYVIMRADGKRNENGTLVNFSKNINAYMIDTDSMGVERKDVNALVMRKLIQTNSYNVTEIEIKRERW